MFSGNIQFVQSVMSLPAAIFVWINSRNLEKFNFFYGSVDKHFLSGWLYWRILLSEQQ